ncbi:MAG: TVP38/TMEM64 family protein [Ardenticatenaceae bacterium]|nr:TVP38/TMEM64 family protein [Ardenticatenaceae bacterium]MCB9445813.1 TVP38/TMEM64 family protein [Ardenticatenaceae bacterium]
MAVVTKQKAKEKRRPPSENDHHAARFSWQWLVGVTAVIISLAFLWVFRQPVWQLLSLVGDQEAVSAYLKGFGLWGPLVLAIVQLIQILAAVIPGHVFLIAAGYVYGFPLGLLLNVVYIVAASQLAFSLARWAGRPFISRLVSKELLEKWYAIGEKQGFTFFTIAFILPAFPTDVMNFVAGLSGISPRKFLAANFLGRLPSAIILTLIGSYGLQFSTAAWVGILLLAVTVYIAGRLIIGRIERQYKSRA